MFPQPVGPGLRFRRYAFLDGGLTLPPQVDLSKCPPTSRLDSIWAPGRTAESQATPNHPELEPVFEQDPGGVLCTLKFFEKLRVRIFIL